MANRNSARRQFASPVWLIVAFLATMGLAGCMGGGGALDDDNNAPDAELEASKDAAWTGDHIRFDGSGSSDSDGEIDRWHFDFGDGTEQEVRNEDEADDVSHTYAHGGEYVVTLTVTDDGGEQQGAKTDTATEEVVVNERQRFAAQVAQPGQGNASSVEKQSVAFETYEGVDRFEIDATAESSMPAGASEIVIRVFDPEGNEIAEERTTVGALDNETIELQSALTDQGTHEIEVEAESGAATVHGELRVYYDATNLPEA